MRELDDPDRTTTKNRGEPTRSITGIILGTGDSFASTSFISPFTPVVYAFSRATIYRASFSHARESREQTGAARGRDEVIGNWLNIHRRDETRTREGGSTSA